MNERAYKYAFVIAVMICLALAGALGYVMRAHNSSTPEETAVVVAKGPEPSGQPSKATEPGNRFLQDAAHAGATVAAASAGDRCNHGDRRNADGQQSTAGARQCGRE